MGAEVQLRKTKKFWRWTLVMVAKLHECTQCHRTVHFKMVKMVNFMLCVFYQNFLISHKKKKKQTLRRIRIIAQSQTISFKILTNSKGKNNNFTVRKPGRHPLNQARRLVSPIRKYINVSPELASLVAQTVKNLPAMRETWVQSLGWHGTHSTILARRIPTDRGAWRATVHGVIKSWTQLSD